MFTTPSLALAYVGVLAAGFAAAQTPPGTQPQSDTKLQVVYGNQTVEPGSTQPKTVAASTPNVSLAANPTDSFTLIMVDLSVHMTADAPNTTLVHFVQTNLNTSSGLKTPLASADPPSAPYIGPSPPAGQTHTYVLYLYRQPVPFVVPDKYKAIFSNITAAVTNRIGFNVTDFATATKLTGPVAANWFDAGTPAGSSSSPSGTGTGTGTGTGSKPTSTTAGSGASGLIGAGAGVLAIVVPGLAMFISSFYLF